MLEKVSEIINGVEVCIDPKIELIGILLTLGNDKDKENFKRLFSYTVDNNKYVNEISETFNYLYDNGLIDIFNKVKDKYNLYYQEPLALMLLLDDSFNLDKYQSYSEQELDNDFYDLVNELKSLFKDKRFINFYQSNIDTYKSWINRIKPFYEDYNLLQLLCNYCGEEYKDLKLINNLIPFETNGGYGIVLDNEAHYCLRSPSFIKDNKMFEIEDKENYLRLTLHEFLHCIINPLTTKYNVFNFDTNYLKDEIDLTKSGYKSDYSIINETIVRAITLRIYNSITGKDISDSLEREYNNGFLHIKDVYSILTEYEQNRDKYNNIDSFYLNICNRVINGQ